MPLGKLILSSILVAGSAAAQLLGPANLAGKYFARHLQVTTDVNNKPTDERSIVGSITFDGQGTYSFSGQQAIGTALPAAFASTGTYTVKGGGEVMLTNPQQSSLTVDARYGADAVVGASTGASGNTFDIFVAIPAPAATTTDSNATLAVSYNFVDYELVLSPSLQLHSGGGVLQFDGKGGFITTSGQGHSSAVNGGAPFTQTPTGSYAVNADGSGTFNFLLSQSVIASGNSFLGGDVRSLAVSQNGNVILAGTPGGHDILIGLRDAGSDNIVLPGAFSGRFWLASFAVNTGDASNVSVDVGSLTVISSDSAAILSERQHQSSLPTSFYLTNSSQFTTGKGGTTIDAGSSVLLPGRGGNFAVVDAGGSAAQPDDNGYSVALLVPIPAVSGGGVFLNPQGVVNAASNAPTGNPISPGEFIALYGTGLAPRTVVTAPPYPLSAGGVSVSIGGLPAPVYLASSGQITCLVPFGVSSTSGTTTIVVNNNGTLSNTVSVPLAPSSPGIFSADLSGQGDGIVVHLNNTLVNAASPAQPNEILTIYLTGLGALQNPVTDGSAPNPPAADSALTNVSIKVDGVPSPKILYAGINPVYPGLYQINFQMPAIPDQGEVQLLLMTSDAATGEITLFAQ